ncbi:hypothetical protein N7490_010870 [Penicillium lividum]|nr:hypothetical protein N7490_010870 [Penicillium lividum]
MKQILFLTTVPTNIVEKYVSDNDWSNEMLPAYLSKRGASVTIKRWMDEDIIPAILDSDLVTFLWAEDYIQHPIEFESFLEMTKRAIEANESATPCVMNHIDLVQWNMDKKYLLDMKQAGFDIPTTEIINAERLMSMSMSALHLQVRAFQSSGPIVLKPSVSASSSNTRLISDISALSDDDLAYIELCTKGDLRSSLVIQRFEPAIATGEYSFIFIGERLSHVALKAPQIGEFRCQPQFGGQLSCKPVDEIEERTLLVVNAIFDTLRRWFGNVGYVRIDGLVTDDRAFILMEIEAIEPDLYLEMGGLQEMLSLMLK